MTTIPCRALGLARELTLAVHCKTEGFLDPAPRRFGGNLRRAALALSLGLEDGGDVVGRCRAALACLWRLSDLVDHAERLGYLDMQDAMDLLQLGSRVEILLVPPAELTEEPPEPEPSEPWDPEKTQELLLPLPRSGTSTSDSPESGR